MKRSIAGFIAVIIILAFLTTLLVGCSDTDGVDSGVVYSSRGKYVKVDEDDGERDTHKVRRSVVRKCPVGARWPDCKNN